ncbi:DUF305 domain-containing protein [Rhodococcus sp. BP-252]|uniref:DUF305 domain-containing protein n=1 Tax=Rhodococcoides kyotonense TaxID=398843 RepID=A0A177YM12_9NOCA|nr:MULTISPECIES: DUF305 domain-containing protein [Rhodococcus]MBY6413939.1 DUF305 domain-containing protein [Rhodococcus sp. BP-320]MBY6418611.1 DUF305 domain-containing protein [Rhodococcus sp. BP-321]MBY6422906.1 DUF305 domain-containing protein [Rhodococcus sp. BP-324]MBY6428745.1 DUF305 domain-containing protein [Rhodococcus sp. BP-323]MBY6433732.1 DUF305 domain-containing protein [Rhodococcus sp. BP-322]
MSTGDTDSARQTARAPGRRQVLVALVGIALVLAGVLIGVLVSPSGTGVESPAPESLEVGFAQDMSVHHNQAIEISAMALDRSSDPVVRTLAYDVLTSQQSQVGTMQGWLAMWGKSAVPTAPPMMWMAEDESMTGHDMSMGMDGRASMSMPGMASSSELQALGGMNGEEFDGTYLQLLRRHHQGGIPMARFGADNASVPVVAAFAQTIASTQTAEIDQIDTLMASHRVAPLSEN